MHKRFLNCIQNKKDSLELKGITTENINVTDDNIPNPSVTVDPFLQLCIGRGSVWENGLMDVEVLHFETEEILLYAHYELDGETNFDEILVDYIKNLVTGINQ